MQNEAASVINALDELLDAERSALLGGKVAEVSKLLEKKVILIERLSGMELRETERLRDLNDKVRHNQELLGQAAAGIRKVAARLAALRDVRGSLDTYDARGSKQRVEFDTEATVEKRA